MSADLARSLDDLEPFERYLYASFVKGRTGGDFKRHKTIGHARNAIGSGNSWNRGHAPTTALYQWDDETKEWAPLNV